MIGRTVEELSPGDSAEITRRVERAAVAGFVDAVGDDNPIHSDPRFAATTPFGEPIAPGIFTGGLISAVIGTRLPGPGTVYLSQTLTFRRPVKLGDTITARVEVTEVVRERNRVRLLTVCRNQRGEEVLTGEAWVMPSRQPVRYEDGDGRAGAAALALQPWAWAARTLGWWVRIGQALLPPAAPTSRDPR